MKMRKMVIEEDLFWRNWIYAIIIMLVIFTNVFYEQLDVLFYISPKCINSIITQFHFIDVGQGDAIAITFKNNKTMLVDSGTSDYQEKLFNYLDHVVLKDTKIIDYLVLSHPDVDHIYNMNKIIDRYTIKSFYSPNIELLETYSDNKEFNLLIKNLHSKNIPIIHNSSNNMIDIGEVSISWLYPYEQDNLVVESSNNLSPVLVIEENNKKVMLTGDIDASVETMLINTYDEDVLDIDVLKLAHHGSKNSTSYEFLKATSPDYVIASVGDNNYGHPANEVLKRLLEYDNEFGKNTYKNFYSTLDKGNIVVSFNDSIVVDFIANIDDYSFIPYWLFSLVFILILYYYFAKPYRKEFWKKLRFTLKDIKFEKSNEYQSLKTKKVKNYKENNIYKNY